MVVGEGNKGKTSLLLNLTKKGRIVRFKEIEMSYNHVPLATVGVDLGDWEYAPRGKNKVTFMTWDFGGQEEYYATHQCFLTKRSLYLLVWDIQDGEAGVRSLKSWLENIEGCAPKSPVIIVGTHLDTIPQPRRVEVENKLRRLIQQLYVDYSNSVYRYPKIQEIFFGNCHDNRHMDRLRDYIYTFVSIYKPPGMFIECVGEEGKEKEGRNEVEEGMNVRKGRRNGREGSEGGRNRERGGRKEY